VCFKNCRNQSKEKIVLDTSIKIGIKFCGNCNPHIDTVELSEMLKNYFKEIQFVNWDAGDYSILLVLNSCTVGCATHPNFSGPKIITKNDSINYESVLPEDLFKELVKKINEYTKT
jgi:hypothetical protein